jgi:hypothetical protein
MLLTISLTISVLVAVNFLLLKFSSNKTMRTSKQDEKPVILRREVPIKSISRPLAPTGS